jgi:hypothetical protein
MRAICAVFFSLTLPWAMAACGPDPGTDDPLAPVSAAFECSDDGAGGAPEWRFVVSISGPVDENRTTAFVETAELANDDGYAMTVEGGNPSTTSFGTTVPGTEDGQEPAPGDVPYSCNEVDDVIVMYCATPEGRPDERPCWACDDGSGGPPPAGAEEWIGCD